MSSFTEPTNIYVFTLINGKKKLAYGKSAEDAFNIMKLRLCPEETEQIIKESAEPINPTKISNYIESLG